MNSGLFNCNMLFLLWSFYFWIICMVQPSTGGGILQIAWNYSNPDSKLDNGNDCDRHFKRQCDVYFQLCLRNAASLSNEQCHLLQHVTQTYPNTDRLSIKGDAAMRLTIPRPVPNSYAFEVSIRDEDLVPNYELIGNFIAANIQLVPDGIWKQIVMSNVSPQKKNSKLSLNVFMELECMDHFYGTHCMVECRPDPKKYDCNANGTKVCFPGLTGPDCNQEDSCYYEACAPHATCRNRETEEGGRICTCNGRESPECYPDHDPCSNSPCQHDGECYAVGAYNESFSCNCSEAWTGHRCNERRLACLEAAQELRETQGKNSSEVCLNGGKCLEYTDKFAYQCQCEEGWTGQHCELPASKVTNWILVGGISFFGAILLLLTMTVALILIWRRRSIRRKHNSFNGRGGIIYYHNNRDSTTTDCSTLSILPHASNEVYGNWRQSNQVLLSSPITELAPKGHINGVYDECDPFGIYNKTTPSDGASSERYSRKVSTDQSRDQASVDDSAPPLPERPQDLGLRTFRNSNSDGFATVDSRSPYTRTCSARTSVSGPNEQRLSDAFTPRSPIVYQAPSTFSSKINC